MAKPKTKTAEGPQVLGTIKDHRILDPTPQGANATYEVDGQAVSVSEPPPPWELADASGLLESDARRFVDAPADLTLRWINPRLLEQTGWRDWQPVSASDPRFKVHVKSMISPENQIRRGGFAGDILAWMYTNWVVSRRKQFEEMTAKQSQSAVDKQRELKEAFARGQYGPNIKLEKARHPRYTNVDTRERD